MRSSPRGRNSRTLLLRSKLTESSLPDIKKKVRWHLDKINSDLNKLPELPANVELEVQSSLIEFNELARSRLKETDKLSSLPDHFRNCLLDMKPKFILKDKSDVPILEISDDESDTSTVTNNTPSKRRGMHPPTTPAKRQRTTDALANGAIRSQIKPEEGRGSVPPLPPPTPTQRPLFPEPFTRFSEVGRGFRTIRQVQDEIKAKRRVGMPEHISEEVYTDLCKESVKPWDGPMKAFLDQIMRLLQGLLESALKKAFERLNKRLVYQESRKHLRNYLEEHRKNTEAALQIVYRLETHGLFTINHDAFAQCKKSALHELTRFRHRMRMDAAGYAEQLIPWERLSEDKRAQEEKRREAEISKIGPDPFERELEVVAYVRGYYRLAALRFADSVALHITNGMIPEIERNLNFYLDNKLGLRGPDALSVYEKLMAEDETIARKREMLKGEREKFVKAMASIEGLETGTRGDGSSHTEELASDVTMSGALDIDLDET